MLFTRIDTAKLLKDNLEDAPNNIDIYNNFSIIPSTEYSKDDFIDIDKTQNFVIICPNEKETNNQIIINNQNIVFINSCVINLSSLINSITPTMGVVKLLFKFKLIIPSEFNFNFYKKYPFILNIFKKYNVTHGVGYNIYSDFEIILYIDFLLLRQYKLQFKINKNTELFYLNIFPMFPINQYIQNGYVLNNSELYTQDNKYL